MAETKILDFIRQVRIEAKKVTIPSKKEVFVTSLVIFIAVIVFALFFTLVDSVIMKSIQLILGLGR